MAAERLPLRLAEYREAQFHSEDSRTVRTRGRIVDAFERLSASEDAVSVSAIVRAAGISRASFYTHFGGLDDLALALQRRVIERLSAWQQLEPHQDGDSSPTDHKASLETSHRLLLGYFAQRRGMYAEILNGPSAGRARDELIDAIAAALEDLGAHAAPSLPADALHLQALQVAGAFATLVIRWLRDEIEADEDTLIAAHTAVLPAWMTADQT